MRRTSKRRRQAQVGRLLCRIDEVGECRRCASAFTSTQRHAHIIRICAPRSATPTGGDLRQNGGYLLAVCRPSRHPYVAPAGVPLSETEAAEVSIPVPGSSGGKLPGKSAPCRDAGLHGYRVTALELVARVDEAIGNGRTRCL